MTRESRYALPLYQLAKEKDMDTRILEELEEIRIILKENLDFYNVLSSYSVSQQRRFNLLDEVFLKDFHPEVINFLKILISEKKMSEYSDIVLNYRNIYFEEKGWIEAEITTAIPLNNELKEELIASLEKKYSKKVIGNYIVDKKIIGGVIVRTRTQEINKGISEEIKEVRRTIATIMD